MTYEFLKHFIKEPIYLIEETERQETTDQIIEEEPESSTDSQIPESEPEAITHVEEPAPKEMIKAESSTEAIPEKKTKVLVIVRYPYVESIPANEKELLVKILRSVSIAIDDITIINVEFGNIPDKNDLDSYTHILIFDNEPATMANLNLGKEFYMQQHIGEINCIIADPLESIHEDTAKKSQL
ncbi:hypothetical protein ACFLU5_11965, partial [Bacteroidota bacterium]